MSEYIKDYFRVSKLIMHYNKYNRMIKYGFALILIAFGGNLQWVFMITAMIFTYLAVPVAFDGVGFILPLTDEERTKRRLTGALIPMLELSLCAALGKVTRYILVCNGIPGAIFISYAFAMCVDFKWIYQLDDMGNIKHLLRLLIAIVLFIIHIILTIHRYLKECRDLY